MFLGKLGVQCFFVLSGWLVTRSFQKTTSVGRFFWHRILRLLPALWLCLAVSALIIAPLVFLTTVHSNSGFFALKPGPLGYFWRNLIEPRTQIGIDYLLGDNPWGGDWNGSLWTLFYEESCYVMVAAVGLAGLLTRFKTAGLTLLLAILALYLFWTGFHPGWFPHIFTRLFDTPGKVLAVHFVSGMIWAMLPPPVISVLTRRSLISLFSICLVLSICYHLDELATPLFLTPLVFWLAEYLPFKNIEIRLGGDYSYGLYLYNYPSLQFIAHFGIQKISFWLYAGLGLGLMSLLAFISWKLVEAPALRLKSLSLRF